MFGIWILKIVTSMMCRSQKKPHKKNLKKTAIKRYNMLMTSTSVRPNLMSNKSLLSLRLFILQKEGKKR